MVPLLVSKVTRKESGAGPGGLTGGGSFVRHAVRISATASTEALGNRLPATTNLGDSLHDVTFEDSVDDIDAIHDLSEHGVVAIEPEVVPEVDEPLRVAGVVASRAHADRAAHVGDVAELVAKVLLISHVLVCSRTGSLDHEVGLDPVPVAPVIVMLTSEREDARRHDWSDVAAQPHHKGCSTTGGRTHHPKQPAPAQREADHIARQRVWLDRRL